MEIAINYFISINFITIYSLALTLSFSFWGSLLLYPFEKQIKPCGDIFTIIGGIFFIIAIGYWLSYKLSAPIWSPPLHKILFWVGLICNSYILIQNFLQKRYIYINYSKQNIYITIILSIILAISAIFLCHNGKISFPSVGGNNDLYSWAIAADIIRNVIPIANLVDQESYIKSTVMDAHGTYLLIGYMASILNIDSIRAIFFTNIYITIWTAYALFKCIRLYFNLPTMACCTITAAIIGGYSFAYIHFNYFEGMLISYLCLYIMILALSKDHNIFNIYLFLPLGILFLSYQSGLLVYLCTVCGICTIYTFFTCSPNKKFYSSIKQIFIPVVTCSLFLVLLFPNIASHLFYRTIKVSHVVAGWSLYLDLFTLSAFPTFTYSLLHYSLVNYILFFIYLFGLFLALIKKEKVQYLFYLLFYIFCIIIYLIYAYITDGIYQSWKFAGMAIAPLAFIPLGCTLSVMYKFFPKANSKLLYIFFITILILQFYNQKNYVKDSLLQFEENIVQLNNNIDKSIPIAILAPTHGQIMLAINKFAPTHPVYPLSPSYLKQWELSDILHLNTQFILPDNPFIKNASMTIIEAKDTFYLLPEGFSDSELLGTWTSGPEVSLVSLFAPLPENFILQLEVTGLIGKNSQFPFDFSIKNSDGTIINRKVLFTHPGTYNIKFNGVLNGKKILIHIPYPTRPCDIDPMSPDSRPLGIMISSAKIKIQKDDI